MNRQENYKSQTQNPQGPIQNVLSRLENISESSNGQSMALCPAHDDNDPSLSIKEETDGTVVMHCFAGCKTEDIVRAIGLDLKDLYPQNDRYRGKKTNRTVYNYEDEERNVLFRVERVRLSSGKKIFPQSQPDGNGGWKKGTRGVRIIPYKLPDFLDEGFVFIAEGEKCVDELWDWGIPATTNPMGAGKWREDYNSYFEGTAVIILPDNDEPGEAHAINIAKNLLSVARGVKILRLPDLPGKGDFIDWKNGLDKRKGRARLFGLMLKTPFFTQEDGTEESDKAKSTEAVPPKSKKVTQSEMLVRLANDAELFFTTEGDGFASVPVNDDHKENWKIRSKSFKGWLMRKFYKEENRPPSTTALNEALGLLEAMAQFDSQGNVVDLHTRVGESDGNIYIDLADSRWRAVEITPDGWQIISDPPVKFRRRKGMEPLPEPEKGGSVSELKSFLNYGTEENFILIVSWLVAALNPNGPYPILDIIGEHGAAKSTQTLLLRSLTDPSTAPLRTKPKNEHDLMIMGRSNWVLAFDNFSWLSDWLSDAFCRLATGGGFSTRRLYTDDDEEIFDAKRPVIFNGITNVGTRADLMDRALVLELPQIREEERIEEKVLLAKFAEARPRILGALLDAVAVGLKNEANVQLESKPRMADFARWVTACEEALPWNNGEFMEAYEENRRGAIETTLSSDPVASAIRAFMEDRDEWKGSPSELLTELGIMVDERTRNSKGWPGSATWLMRNLTRSMPFLRSVGIDIQRTGKDREVMIKNDQE